MTPRLDFVSQDYLRDPAAGSEKLRARGPVLAVRFPIVGKVWITTTFGSDPGVRFRNGANTTGACAEI